MSSAPARAMPNCVLTVSWRGKELNVGKAPGGDDHRDEEELRLAGPQAIVDLQDDAVDLDIAVTKAMSIFSPNLFSGR